MNSFWQLTAIHFKEYFREPGILFWTLAFPAAMAWILGVAFSSDIKQTHRIAVVGDPAGLPLVIANAGGTAKGARPQNKTGASGVSFETISATMDQAKLLMRQGRVTLTLERTATGWTAHYDPRNSEAELTFMRLERALQSDGMVGPTRLQARPVTEHGQRYVDFLVPGLLAMGVMNSCLWGIGWSLIELRIKKLMRRMVASPMRRSEFLLSFFVVRLTLSLVEATVLFGFARAYFAFEVQGSWAGFAALFVAGNIAFWGLGVLLSSRAASARTANGLINFVTLPLTIVGGVFFSYHNFPDAVATVIAYTPLALLADGLRAVSNEAATLYAVLPGVGLLLITGMAAFALGLRLYKWH